MAWIKDRWYKNGDPYWSVCWRELDHQTGKSRQASISYDDKADAVHCKTLVDQLGPERARDVLKIVQTPRNQQTVADYLAKHIDHLTGVEEATTKRYRAYVRNDLHPIGTIPLTALTRDDIAAWVNAMPGGAKTVKNKRDFVSGALKGAVKAGLIPSNPCEGVRNPRWDRREMVFLERDEFALLLSEFGDHWRPLVQFLVTSGCRWSEATALQPADIDIVTAQVRVHRAWKKVEGGYELGPPKTKKSVRTINMPATVLQALDLSGEWVFTNSGRGKGQFADGLVRADPGPVRIHNFHPNVWRPAVQRAQAAGLRKDPRIHDLRHTCASWLIAAGRPVNAVQAQLGHESAQTTLDRYSHLDRTSGRENAAVMAAMLG